MEHESPHLDKLFEALAHKHRREIIYTLGLQSKSISQLAAQQNLSLPAIYKHITVMEEAELIMRKKSGRTNFLALNKKSLGVLQKWLMQYHTYWGNQEESLENYVKAIEQAEEQVTK
jgi:DNA-binding transcriptional ArsR family regulator